MPAGLLKVQGTIDAAQFWPRAGSDADTAKVTVDGPGGAFKFRPHPGAPWKTTHVFDEAEVRGRTRNKCIKNNRITIRFQGIDAPELHYRPPAALKRIQQTAAQRTAYLKWNLEYRQHLAETASVELAKLVKMAGTGPVPCEVLTRVDEPDEVFDSYGRFVGEVVITINGKKINLNRRLVRDGWAYPAFYASMTEDEISDLTADAAAAWSTGAGVWAHPADYVAVHDGKFDFDLEYRRPSSSPAVVTEAGPIVIPKLFRRLSTWAVNRRARMVTGNFRRYLKDRPDHCYLTADFLDQGPTAAVPRRLDEFIDPDGFVNVWPEDLVFQESASSLRPPGGGEPAW